MQRKKRRTAEERMLDEVGRYLQSRGWKVIVIGGGGVRERPGQYNFEFTLNFTGGKPKGDGG